LIRVISLKLKLWNSGINKSKKFNIVFQLTILGLNDIILLADTERSDLKINNMDLTRSMGCYRQCYLQLE